MTDRPHDLPPDIDALLQTTLPDDLPSEVEARLNDQLERFLVDRRRGVRGPLAEVTDGLVSALAWVAAWPAGPSLRMAASAVLVVCGFVLHATGGAGVFAAPVARVNESVALWEAIGRAASMRCTDAARDDLRSPAEFAERVLRRWVLVASTIDATGTARVLTFKSPDDGAQYDLVVDRRSMLPRRVVKTLHDGTTSTGGVAAGYDAGCSWDTPASGSSPGERTYGQR
jgi:hypothetical protein